jgi:2'-phosphotransferase
MADDNGTAERMEALALQQGKGKGKGGPRGGGGGRRGGGGKGGEPNREVLVSKALSTLLRHKALEAGIDLDSEGYASLDKVVSVSLFYSHEEWQRET